MTTPAPPDGPAGRPVPDTTDLRLLAELINNDYIGLPQAAWNARMSQQEAAARLVTMAERGMPLRLVAEGDRQALWRIAQAGPATGGLVAPGTGGAPQIHPGPPSGAHSLAPHSGAVPQIVPAQTPAGADPQAWSGEQPQARNQPPTPAGPQQQPGQGSQPMAFGHQQGGPAGSPPSGPMPTPNPRSEGLQAPGSPRPGPGAGSPGQIGQPPGPAPWPLGQGPVGPPAAPSSGSQGHAPQAQWGTGGPTARPPGPGPAPIGPIGPGPINQGPAEPGPLGQGPLGHGPMGQGQMGHSPMSQGPMGPMGQGPAGPGMPMGPAGPGSMGPGGGQVGYPAGPGPQAPAAPVAATWGPPSTGGQSGPLLPPTPAVPPHEQAIAGAVPLGEPPFGTPAPEPRQPVAQAAAPDAPTGARHRREGPVANDSEPPSGPAPEPEVASVWGIPGSAWARTDDDPVPAGRTAQAPADAAGSPEPAPRGGRSTPVDPEQPGPEWSTRTAASGWASQPAASVPDRPAESGPAPQPAEPARDVPQQPVSDPDRAPETAPAGPSPDSSAPQFVLPTALVSAHLETAAPGSPTASEDYGDRTVRADRAQLLGDDTGSWNAPAAAPPAAEDYGDRTVQATRAQLFGDDTDSRRPDPEPNPSAVTFPAQDVNGLFGERLTIAVSAWIDPADEVLTTAGYRLDDGERAVLVCTDLHNAGPIDYESLPDLYLELVADDGRRLTKAAISVAGHPAHRVGVPAGSTSSGWTVFLIPTDERASAIQWSVRPDLADRTVRWDLPGRS